MAVNPIDLHTHTTASDGSLPPDQLVAYANEIGVRVLGVTDHDTTDGIEPAREAARRYGIQLIPGIELSTEDDGCSIHILGYYIDPSVPALQAQLRSRLAMRIERSKQIVARLQADGYRISWEKVEATSTGRVISRPQIAKALIEARYAESVDDAFARFVGPEAPYFVPRPGKLTPADAINLIRRSGGVAVLAHPVEVNFSSQMDDFALGRLDTYVSGGLQGLEAYYTGYSPEVSERIIRLAQRYDLIMTGGSDFHGSAKPTYHLGGVRVPQEVLEHLLEAREIVARVL